MSKKISLFLYISAFILIFCCCLITAGSFILRDLKYYADRSFHLIEKQTGFKIKITDIDLTGFGVKMNHFQIIEPGTNDNLLTCRNLLIQIKLTALLKRELTVSRIIFQDPVLAITGIKNGNWTGIVPFPLSLSTVPDESKFFQFSFSPDKVVFRNGRLLYKNSQRDVFTSLDHINSTVRLKKTVNAYIMTASATHTRKQSSGTLKLTCTFSFADNIYAFDKLSVQGDITLKALPALGLIPDLKRFLKTEYLESRLDGSVNFNIFQGIKFNSSGKLYATFPELNAKNRLYTVFNLRGSQDKIFADHIFIDYPGVIKAKMKASLLHPGSDSAEASLSLIKGSVDLKNIQNIISDNCLPGNAEFLFNRIHSGTIFFDNLILSGTGDLFMDPSGCLLSGKLKLLNSRILLKTGLPFMTVNEAALQFFNTRLTGSADVRLFDNDKISLNFSVDDLFQKKRTAIILDAVFSAQDINAVINAASNSDSHHEIFTAVSGSANAHCDIRIAEAADVKGTIDFSALSYRFMGKILKPAGLTNRLRIHSQDLFNRALYFTYNFLLTDSLELNGTFNAIEPYQVKGTYKLNAFRLKQLEMQFFPRVLSLSGMISGSGNFQIPSRTKTGLPLTGNLIFNDLSLTDTTDHTALLTVSLASNFQTHQVNILQSSIQLGVTDISAEGSLNTAIPPAGHLDFEIDYFDIDNFIDIIRTIVRSVSNRPSPGPVPAENSFKKIDLDVDLNVRTGNYLKWDFDNATSRFTYRGGTLTWNQILLQTDTGPVSGKVVYDYTNPGQYCLEFYPEKTDIDFTSLIPSFKKNKKITGQTNLSGSFKSVYNYGHEIIPNMKGLFNVQMKNGVIRRSKVFSAFMNHIGLSKSIDSNATEKMYKSLPFDSIDADFVMTDGIIKTEDLIMTSPAINLTGVGSMDLKKGEVDFIVGTQVLKTIGKILGNIPIAGDLFTVDNKALTVGYFHVHGPFDNPAVSALPFKSLGLGIKRFFKTILDIPLILVPDLLYDQKKKTDASAQ